MHSQFSNLIVITCLDVDLPLCGGKLICIFDKVDQYLLEPALFSQNASRKWLIENLLLRDKQFALLWRL